MIFIFFAWIAECAAATSLTLKFSYQLDFESNITKVCYDVNISGKFVLADFATQKLATEGKLESYAVIHGLHQIHSKSIDIENEYCSLQVNNQPMQEWLKNSFSTCVTQANLLHNHFQADVPLGWRICHANLHFRLGQPSSSALSLMIDLSDPIPMLELALHSPIHLYPSLFSTASESAVSELLPAQEEQFLSIDVIVNDLMDSPASSSSCNNSDITNTPNMTGCTLRSAVAFCLSTLSTTSSYFLCTIHLPSFETIQLEPTLGEVVIQLDDGYGGRLVLQGNGATVQPTNAHSMRLFLLSSTSPTFTVQLHNFTITSFGTSTVNGGAVFISGSGVILLSSLWFHSNIGASGSSILVEYCDGLVTVMDSIFDDNTALVHGGAIFISNSHSGVSVLMTSFSNNQAQSNGGAIYIDSSSGIFLSECTFSFNEGVSGGGAVYLYKNNANVSLVQCTLEYNRAELYGAAFAADSYNNEVNITACMFRHHFLPLSSAGGAMYFGSSNYVYVKNSTFFNNSASIGGGIAAGSTTVLNIEHSSFINNTAYEQGSAVSARFRTCHILDSVFIGNNGNLGTVFATEQSSYLLVLRCVFRNNQAYAGAAIYFAYGTFNNDIVKCEFDHGLAVYGGAIYLLEQVTSISISDSLFSHNYASSSGGALFGYSINTFLTIANCTFDSNQASGDGGAIYGYDAQYSYLIRNSTFIRNVAGLSGGAIHFESDSAVRIENCVFTSNTAAFSGGAVCLAYQVQGSIASVLFEHNAAKDGGALGILTRIYNCEVNSVLFVNNSARGGGGAVFLRDSNANSRFVNATFNSNTAGSHGGGLYILSSNPNLIIESCIFIQNVAVSSGAGLHSALSNYNITISRSLFSANIALYGAGMYIGDDHDEIIVADCILTNNEANYGGGVYVGSFNSLMRFSGCRLDSNVASLSGGGIYALPTTLSLTRCILANNTATNAGGLYTTSDNVIVNETSFNGNIALEEGGGVVVEEVVMVLISNCTFLNNRASNAAAFSATLSISIFILNSTFELNVASRTGGAIFADDIKTLSLDHCQFLSNIADTAGACAATGTDDIFITNCISQNNTAMDLGGVFKLSNSLYALIDSCVFDNNTAALGGAALYLYSIDTVIQRSYFLYNSVVSGSGAVYWVKWTGMAEPIGIGSKLSSSTYNNTFVGNNATYGSMWATEGVLLRIVGQGHYNVTAHATPLPPVQVELVDYYNQVVTTDSSSAIEASAVGTTCYTSGAYVTGGVIDIVRNGEANFTTLEAYCSPGYTMPISFIATNDDFVTAASITVSFRQCVRGEYYSGGLCITCEPGTYSLSQTNDLSALSQISVCENCPSQASTCYGDHIILKRGYWRVSVDTVAIFICPTGTRGCKGGAGAGEDLCNIGYEGPLCAVCSSGYALQSSVNSCEPCHQASQSDPVTYIYVAILLAIILGLGYCYSKKKLRSTIKNFDDLVLYIIIKLRFIKPDTRHKAAILRYAQSLSGRMQARLKVYITLYQILSVLPFVLNMTFPNPVSAFISALRFMNVSIRDSSLVSCSASDYDFIDSLVVDTLYPIVLCLIICGLRVLHVYYLLHTRVKQEEGEISRVKDNYVSAVLVLSFLVLPSVSAKIFQTFRCASLLRTS